MRIENHRLLTTSFKVKPTQHQSRELDVLYMATQETWNSLLYYSDKDLRDMGYMELLTILEDKVIPAHPELKDIPYEILQDVVDYFEIVRAKYWRSTRNQKLPLFRSRVRTQTFTVYSNYTVNLKENYITLPLVTGKIEVEFNRVSDLPEYRCITLNREYPNEHSLKFIPLGLKRL